MNDNYGVEKAALGIRHLLKYLENRKQENFNVVLDCIEEIKLWCLITSFCNNIDDLFDKIPDFVLENIFTTRVSKGETVEEVFGKGFRSNLDLPYREEFRKIRGLLSHGKFNYNKGIIYVFDEKYEAYFDIKWLEKLIRTTLGHKRLGLEKGMSDISVMSLIGNVPIDIEYFKECIDLGLIQFYKVTALSGNKETIAESLKSTGITKETITFELLFQTALSLIRSERINLYNSLEANKRELKEKYKAIEKFFGNKIKVEDMPIKVSQELLEDEDFINLDFKEKISYLIRNACLSDPILYNGLMLQNLLELFENFKKGVLSNFNVFTLKDAKNFLLKVYANIYFVGVQDKNSSLTAQKHDIQARYIHAQNIYKEYIKVLTRSYKELEEYNGSKYAKSSCLYNLKHYEELLIEITENPLNNFSWKMRNSIIHNHIEFNEGFIRFYNTGKNLKLNHFNKKTKTWEFKDFKNNRTIWEMTCTYEQLISLLDELFEQRGIEVNVNITKYTKRKNYLK